MDNRPAANSQELNAFSHHVSETLLITLYARAVESRQRDALIYDPVAEQLVDQLDYNFIPFNKKKTQAAVAIRARYFDDCCRQFIRSHTTEQRQSNPPAKVSQANIISLGSGLDSRNSRLIEQGDIAARFFDIDFTDVIELRRQLIPQASNNQLLGFSALDKRWMQQICSELNQQPLLIVAEGLFMYLTQVQITQLIHLLRFYFPQAELLFDATTPWYSKVKQETVRHTQASFSSAIRCPRSFADQHYLELLSCENVWQLQPQRWGLLGQLAQRIAPLRNVHQFLHYRF